MSCFPTNRGPGDVSEDQGSEGMCGFLVDHRGWAGVCPSALAWVHPFTMGSIDVPHIPWTEQIINCL